MGYSISAAAAPTAPAAAPAGPRFGPPVAGLCLFARKDALETSEAGKDIARRVGGAELHCNSRLLPSERVSTGNWRPFAPEIRHSGWRCSSR